MKKLAIGFFVPCLSLYATLCAFGQTPAVPGPPRIIRIFREEIKPGRGAVHEKVEVGYVRAFSKSKVPFHYLAIASMTGPNEVWFLEGCDSFEDMEKLDRAFEKDTALTAQIEQLDRRDGDLRTGQRGQLAVLRDDLSYRMNVVIGTMRYFEIVTLRVRPGHEGEFEEAAKMLRDANEKANRDEHYAVYQVLAGASSGTMLVFAPMKSLKEVDIALAPENRMAAMKAMGEQGAGKFQKLVSDSLITIESNYFSFSPKMSHAPKEVVGADPDFWTPKPKLAPKPAAAKVDIGKPAAKP